MITVATPGYGGWQSTSCLESRAWGFADALDVGREGKGGREGEREAREGKAARMTRRSWPEPVSEFTSSFSRVDQVPPKGQGLYRQLGSERMGSQFP